MTVSWCECPCVQMVRDAFDLAREKAKDRGGAIIFIDEIDAIGIKRHDSDQTGDREVQRTMLELLNQLDGFSSDIRVKVIAATNRPDILDPALLRSVRVVLMTMTRKMRMMCLRQSFLLDDGILQGRLDRKIELPHPNEKARAQILGIHSRKVCCRP